MYSILYFNSNTSQKFEVTIIAQSYDDAKQTFIELAPIFCQIISIIEVDQGA